MRARTTRTIKWLGKSLIGSSSIFVQQEQRTISTLGDYSGSLSSINASYMHLAPIKGAVFSETNTLDFAYDMALETEIKSATDTLVLSLFHKYGDELRNTRNKSNPAYSLTPAIIAQINSHLEDGTLSQEVVKENILSQLRSEHKKLTGGQITRKKILALIDNVLESNQECMNDQYPSGYTNLVLSSLTHHKITTKEDVNDYVQVLNSHISGFEKADEVGKGNKEVNPSDKVSYEAIIAEHISNNTKLNEVKTASYRYKDNESVTNCMETAFHNLCNVMLHDRETGKFDFSLLPNSLNPVKQFTDFYKMQQFNTDNINLPEVGQDFMDLVSGNDAFSYVRGNYELDANTTNLIPVMNYLFGSEANTLEELSQQLSTESRMISFVPGKDSNSITISIQQQQYSEQLEFVVYPVHALTGGNFAKDEYGLENIGSDMMIKHPELISLSSIQNLFECMAMPSKDLHTKVALLKLFDHFRKDANELKMEFLSHAISAGEVELVKVLLDKGADANKEDMYRMKPLRSAIFGGNVEIMQVLLEHGADVNKEGLHGNTLLRGALLCGRKEIVKILLDHGLDVNKALSVDKFNQILLAAIKNVGNVEIIKVLLDHGADVNKESRGAELPLTSAINSGNIEIIKVLLDHGADLNKRSTCGVSAYTPLEFAEKLAKFRERSNPKMHKIVKLLKAAEEENIEFKHQSSTSGIFARNPSTAESNSRDVVVDVRDQRLRFKD